MISAQVAEVIAEEIPEIDQEVAYLAGMLQNLGEVLVAHRTPDRHLAIVQRIDAGCARDMASMMEVGFTFDHLARLVGRYWKLSPSVYSVWDQSRSAANLTQLVRFANELTRVMLLDSDANREAGLSLLQMRYGSVLRLSQEDVADVWGRALTDIRTTFDALGVSLASLGLSPVSLKQAS